MSGGVAGRNLVRAERGREQPLIGRDEERARLAGALRPDRPRPPLVVLVGEPGIGKTALLEDACRRLTPSWEVVRARVTKDRPGALLTLSSHAALGDIDATENLLAELAAAATERPTCLVVDDLHWADAGTARFLRALRSQASVAILAATRLHPMRPDVTELVAAADDRIEVTPLDDETLLTLALGHGGPQTSELETAIRRCGGNPLLAELVVEAEEYGSFAAIEALVERRLLELSAGGQHLVRSAAILGTTFQIDDLAVVMGMPVAALLPACEEAVAAGLLRIDETFRFRHELVRDAVYGSVPAAMRRAIHRDIAYRLTAAGRPRVSLCSHLIAASTGRDEETFVFLLDTAKDVMLGSPNIARDILEQALGVAPPAHPRVAEAEVQLARALVSTGVPRAASALLCGSVTRTLPPDTEFAVRTAMIEAAENAADLQGVREQLLAREQIQGLPERLRTWARIDRIQRDAEVGSQDELDGIVAAARAATDRELLLRAQIAAYALSASRGERHLLEPRAEDLMRTCRELWPAGGADALRLVLEAHWLWADVPWRDLDMDVYVDRCRQALHIAEASGAAGRLFFFQTLIAEGLLLHGDWEDAEAEASTAVAWALDYGERTHRVAASGILAWLHVRRGEFEGAARLLEETEDEEAAIYEGPWRAWAKALQAEARGERDVALSELLRLRSAVFMPQVARLAVLTDNQAVIEGLPALRTFWSLAAPAIRLHVRAWLEHDVDRMIEAATVYEQTGPRTLQAIAFDDVAALLGALDRSEEARPWLERAFVTWRDLGATWDVERVRGALRSLGVRRAPPRRRPRATAGWDALTATERRVAELVALGLSNPEVAARLFVSRRTVTTHLSNVFAKLSVRSRTELAALVATRRSTTAP